MTATIDKLVFAIDADLGPYKAKLAEAEREAQSSGAKVSASAKRTLGDLQAKYDPTYASAQKLAKAQIEINTLMSAGRLSTEKGTKALEDFKKALGEAGKKENVSGLYELRALFDELSTGRSRYLPSTLSIIATRMFGISFAALAAGAAIAAIPVGLALAANSYISSIDTLDNALVTHKGLIDIDAAAAEHYANQIANLADVSVRSARTMEAAFIRGGISPSTWNDLAAAAQNYAKATDQDVTKAMADLAAKTSDPAKAARALTEEFGLFDQKTVQTIQALLDLGEKTQAEQLFADKLKDHFASLHTETDGMTSGLHGLSVALSNAYDWMGKMAVRAAGVFQGGPQMAGAFGMSAYSTGAGGRLPGAVSITPRVDLAARNKEAGELATVMKSVDSIPQQIRSLEATRQRIHGDIAASIITKAEGGRYLNYVASEIQRLKAEESRKGESPFDRQQRFLAAAKSEADAAEAIAKAYGVSVSAAEHAKIAGEAHAALVRKQVLDEKAYAAALEKRAFWQEAATSAQKASTQAMENTGLTAVAAASGNPAMIAAARRAAEARQALAPEFNAATTPTEHMRAYADFTSLLNQYRSRDRLNIAASVNSTLYGARGRIGMVAAGFQAWTPDDQRHLRVAQQSFDQLVHLGVDPASKAFMEMYDRLVPVNEKLSDMQDDLQKVHQAAQGMANAITGPLQSFIDSGGKGGFRQLGVSMTRGLIGSAARSYLTNPLNDWLTGQFGSLLGGKMNADGTMANPFYVVPLGAAGLGGTSQAGGLLSGMMGLFGGGGSAAMHGPDVAIQSLGGSGFLSGIFGSSGLFGSMFGGGGFLSGLFGGGAAAGGAAAAGGGLFAGLGSTLMSILPFLFLAEGGHKPYGRYAIVGENGPEILGPETAGFVTPLTAPSVSHAGGSPGLTVSGSSLRYGAPTGSTNFGDVHNHFPNVRDRETAVIAASQFAARMTHLSQRGRRNS